MREAVSGRALSAGVDIEEAMKSVTFSSGDRLYVDTDHPSYPKPPKGLGDYVADGLSVVVLRLRR